MDDAGSVAVLPKAESRPQTPDDNREDLGSLPPPWRHPRYYLNDELVIFRVEGKHLFRVHRWFFERESIIFKGMFECPPEGSQEGKTDGTAIDVPGVTKFEFESLLDHIYYRMQTPGPEASIKHWAALLSIAHRFFFEDIRDQAVRKLSILRLDPVERIVLARKHEVDEWIVPSYCDLCQREKWLTEEEAMRIGVQGAVRLAGIRERLLKGESSGSWQQIEPHSPTTEVTRTEAERYDHQQIFQMVFEVFTPPNLRQQKNKG